LLVIKPVWIARGYFRTIHNKRRGTDLIDSRRLRYSIYADQNSRSLRYPALAHIFVHAIAIAVTGVEGAVSRQSHEVLARLLLSSII
jgi:hypothetical protein